MRCLGLDLGTKTLGIAISDKTNQIASFLKVVRWDGEHYDLLFKELSVKKTSRQKWLLPVKQPSLNFEKALKEKYSLDVILIDERLSTVEAENYLLEADTSRKKRKKVIDGVAASIILDTYLRMKGNNKNE